MIPDKIKYLYNQKLLWQLKAEVKSYKTLSYEEDIEYHFIGGADRS